MVKSGSTLFAAAVLLSATTAMAGGVSKKVLERGEYLLTISGCNDCHTEGYLQTNGEVAREARFTGSAMGFSGPWGTTYPANLRLVVDGMSEAQWLEHARTPRRPPMPWFNLKQMTDKDLAAVYHYLRHLGPKGTPAPAYVPPGTMASTPYIDFTPKNLPMQEANAAR